MNQYFTSYSPRVRAIFRDSITTEEICDVTNDIISLSTNKAYGRCCGTWQLMLPHRTSSNGATYPEVISTDDMLTIEMDAGNGAGWFPVMLGLVDRVSLVRQGGAVPIRQIKVSGQDFGKILSKHDIAWDIMKHNEEIVKSDDSGGTEEKIIPSRPFTPEMQMGTPSKIIKAILDVAVLSRLDTAKRFSPFEPTTDDQWKLVQPNLMTLKGCSAWSAMDRVSQRPYNILTTDTNQKNVLFFDIRLEKYPVDKIGKLDATAINTDKKTLHTIDDTEIISSDLGLSDHERINLLYFNVTYYAPTMIMTPDIALMLDSFHEKDVDSIKKHGLCMKTINAESVSPGVLDTNKDVEGQPKFAADAKERKDLFWEWFRRNHELESGTITVHLRPDIRVGHGLLVRQGSKEEFKEYLIEQVAHQCVFHPVPQFVTTLHVTRGQEAPSGKAAQAGAPKPVETAQ